MEVVHLSPRRMCECGKTVLKLSEDERKEYNEAIRRIREAERTKLPAANANAHNLKSIV